MKTETKPKPKVPKIPAAPESRAPALAAEAWPVDRPKPYERNPRRNDAAVEKVAASIREFGWAQPIVVDGDGVIIIGHTRLKAAKKLGLKTVPVLVRADLSPEQVAALRLADNKTAELAEWDEPLLAAELDALVGAVDMEQFGFDLSAPELTEGQTDEDAVPEPPPEPVSRRGAVYALGRHRLMCGDSTSAEDVARLMAGERGDILFTSPPYSDMREYNGGKDLSVVSLQKFISVWAGFADYECVNLGIQRKGNEIVPYWDGYIAEAHTAGLKLLAWNVWDKGECGAIAAQSAFIPIRHEWIFVFGREVGELNATVVKKTAGKKQSTFSGQRQRDGTIKKHLRKSTNSRLKKMESVVCVHTEKGAIRKEHPATFPVALPTEYIKAMTGDGEIVLEPFGGSGTTLIACEQTNRRARLMELDPHYCDVIRKRWAEFVHGEGCDWQTLAPEADE